ncbi:IQ domain-containing protein M, partial [Rhea pennata]|uniref:IQ domain-containing protein M n=1 Tax=Rhea pennata TaxID=8795 RepID=UPI002E25EFFB
LHIYSNVLFTIASYTYGLGERVLFLQTTQEIQEIMVASLGQAVAKVGIKQEVVAVKIIWLNSLNDTKPFGMASSKRIFPQVSWLEERLYKLPGRPFPEKFIPTSPEKAVKSCKTYYIYPSPQYTVEKEERISVTELLSKIDSVSRALENEKNENFSSLSDRHLDLQTQKKIKKNGTHLKVFEAFHDGRMHSSSREVLKSVICIQRYVRGWLECRAFKRIKIKATSQGLSLPAVVKCYRKMMARIKCRAGVLDLSTPLRYFELEEWMDKKKFYEAMFAKRQFNEEMDRNDLPGFFKDCGYFIPTSGVQRAFQMVCPASTAPLKSIKKHQAIEMAFTLFPPLGANVKNIITVASPWVHPLTDGKGGCKNSGKNFNPLEGYEYNEGHEGVVPSASSIRTTIETQAEELHMQCK